MFFAQSLGFSLSVNEVKEIDILIALGLGIFSAAAAMTTTVHDYKARVIESGTETMGTFVMRYFSLAILLIFLSSLAACAKERPEIFLPLLSIIWGFACGIVLLIGGIFFGDVCSG